MVLYIGEALAKYRENFGLLVATSFALMLIGLAQIAPNNIVSAVFSVIGTFATSIAYVFVYQKILGTYKELRESVIQGLWAWIAQTIVGIAVALALLVSLVFLLIPTVGRVLTLAAWVAILVFAAKFMYIYYLAARGNSLYDILKKSWNAKLDVAIRALAGSLVVGLGILILAGLPIITVIGKIAVAIANKEPLWLLLGSTSIVPSIILTGIIFAVLVPVVWMFPLVSGKDAVGE